jgi:hypothetical protein
MVVVLHDLPLHLAGPRTSMLAPGLVLRDFLLQQVVLLLELTPGLLELMLSHLQLAERQRPYQGGIPS